MKTMISYILIFLSGSGILGPTYGQVSANTNRDSTIHVAVLVFPEVGLHELLAPLDVFLTAQESAEEEYHIFTLGITDDTVASEHQLMRLLPAHSAWEDPEIDILIVPGGAEETIDSLMVNSVFRSVLGGMMRKASYTVTVGSGSYLVASTAKLDGQNVAVDPDIGDDFPAKFPNVRMAHGEKFVKAGNIITTSDRVSGIGAALWLIRKFSGDAIAQRVSDLMDESAIQTRKDGN